MINLLPPEEKKELLSKKRNKLFIILGSVLVVFLICLILVLFSVKIYLLGENVVLEEELNEVKKEHTSANLALAENSIKKYNKDLENFKNFYESQIYVNSILKSLFSIEFPKGVYLINVSIDKNIDNSLNVSVYGFSDSRDNLLILKDLVEKEKNIKNPIFSQDSWTKNQNINFYLTFQY